MKKVIIIASVLMVVIVGLFLLSFVSKTTNDIVGITSFHYSYSSGDTLYDGVSYDIYSRSKNKYELIYKADEVPARDAIKVNISQEDMNKLEEILNEYKVARWNGFNESDRYILDGNSFHLNIDYRDGGYVTAYGYMKYPNNYFEAQKKIESYLRDLAKRK